MPAALPREGSLTRKLIVSEKLLITLFPVMLKDLLQKGDRFVWPVPFQPV